MQYVCWQLFINVALIAVVFQTTITSVPMGSIITIVSFNPSISTGKNIVTFQAVDCPSISIQLIISQNKRMELRIGGRFLLPSATQLEIVNASMHSPPFQLYCQESEAQYRMRLEALDLDLDFHSQLERDQSAQ